MANQQNIIAKRKAPKVQILEGNPEIKIETADNAIFFPGGSIGVSRTSDNEYWVHIVVTTPNTAQPIDGYTSVNQLGRITDFRVQADADGFPERFSLRLATGARREVEHYVFDEMVRAWNAL